MPISLGDLQRNTRQIVAHYDGEDVAITYAPGKLTPASVSGNDARQSLEALLGTTLLAWDVLDDAGKPLPVTQETLSAMPSRFLWVLVDAINEDIRPNGRRAAT